MKRGNISLIVLFILTITSLIGLLAINHIRTMLSYNTTTIGYYKAHYYSKAGTELGLVASNLYEIGFEDIIESSGHINKNFSCYGQPKCGISTIISNRISEGKWLTNKPDDYHECTEQNAFSLNEGQSLVIPLFVDTRKLSNDEGKYPVSVLNEIDLGLKFIQEPTNVSGDVLGLGFSVGSGAAEFDRDILYQEFANIKTHTNTTGVINSFLDDPTPLFYKKLDDRKTIDPDSLFIKPKRDKFHQSDLGQNIANFLIIKHPHRCPSNTEESGILLSQIVLTKDEIDEGKTKCTCKKETGLQYDPAKNACVPKSQLTESTESTEFTVVTNPHDPIKFCLQVNNEGLGLSTQYTTVNSIGASHHIQTSLQAVKKTYFPDWLFSTVIER